MTHICVDNLTIIGSDNGLSPDRRQAIIWHNAGILLIGPLGTKFNEIFNRNSNILIEGKHLKMSSAKWQAFCLGLYVLKIHTRLALSPRMAGPPLSGKHSHRLHLSGQAIGKKYSAVPLSRGQFSHRRLPIARPWGRAMECLLWV